MARKKHPLTISEAVAEMSIAGEPDRVEKVAEQIKDLMATGVDTNNLPTVDNLLIALDVLQRELRHWRKTLYDRQHPKQHH